MTDHTPWIPGKIVITPEQDDLDFIADTSYCKTGILNEDMADSIPAIDEIIKELNHD